MEQRRLRLGDILDDYCPRERRVTNHAVVAMIEEDVKQTRCTTCDAEHVYKGAKAPRRRSRKDSPEGLFHEVLAGMPETGVPAPIPASEVPVDDVRSEDEVHAALASRESSVAQDEPPVAAAVEATHDETPASAPPVEEGPIHRRLIRAQLPRPEGQKEVRQVPDFTIRNNNNGRGHFRGMRGGTGQPDGNGHGAGNRPHGRRFGGGGNPGMPGGRPGGGHGPSTGRGPSPAPGGRSGRPGFGPRKRSR